VHTYNFICSNATRRSRRSRRDKISERELSSFLSFSFFRKKDTLPANESAYSRFRFRFRLGRSFRWWKADRGGAETVGSGPREPEFWRRAAIGRRLEYALWALGLPASRGDCRETAGQYRRGARPVATARFNPYNPVSRIALMHIRICRNAWTRARNFFEDRHSPIHPYPALISGEFSIVFTYAHFRWSEDALPI